MYTIQLDIQRNKLEIMFRGHIDLDELLAYTNDVFKIISKSELSQLLVLVDIEKLDPFSQECLDTCINGLAEASYYIKKMAVVYKKVVTRMQFKRIIYSVNSQTKGKLLYQLFMTRIDALTYLYE
jgi:uncharacterized iron-regulated protein